MNDNQKVNEPQATTHGDENTQPSEQLKDRIEILHETTTENPQKPATDAAGLVTPDPRTREQVNEDNEHKEQG